MDLFFLNQFEQIASEISKNSEWHSERQAQRSQIFFTIKDGKPVLTFTQVRKWRVSLILLEIDDADGFST